MPRKSSADESAAGDAAPAGSGEKAYRIKKAEPPYRVMIEAMIEGAAIADARGAIQYCNGSFATLVSLPMEKVLGAAIQTLVDAASRPVVEELLTGTESSRREVTFRSASGRRVQAYLSAKPLDVEGEGRAIFFVAMDISEQREAEYELRNAEIKYQSIFENTLEGIFQVSNDGVFIGANPAMARLYGYASAEELLRAMNRNADALYAQAGRKLELLELLRQRSMASGFESQIVRADGSKIWIAENVHSVHDAAGFLQFFEGNAVDISERKQHEVQLERHANYDALTGLANRRLLHERLTRGVERAAKDGRTLTVAYIDLDKFKYVNDSLGHNVGDRLLQVMAERLRRVLREDDTVARQGGDEFVLLLEQSETTTAPQVMQRLLHSVAEPVVIDKHELVVTCSIGYSTFPSHGRDADTLLKNADAAMYLAKERGRNNVQAYTDALNQEIGRKLSLEASLRRALKREELSLYYQPQVQIRTNEVVAAEALLRWAPTMVEGLADDLIPLAEDTGLIVPIGEWVLRAACAQAKAWQPRVASGLHMAVNLSPRQFREKGLVQMVASALRESGLDAESLELEVTEGLVMHDVEAAAATMLQLREMGIRISIDDFGIGHSSLGQLKRLPIDVLKIDRAFIRDLDSPSGETPTIARTIIDLGHSLNLRVVAEGVETKAQLDFLRQHGCDAFQGFLVSKAVPAALFSKLFLGERRQREAAPAKG
jgi:diguanylate cyclase (GGDEF)-like protein/PAS domain S-box-containing protein